MLVKMSFSLHNLVQLKAAVSNIESQAQKISKSAAGLSFAEVIMLLCIRHFPTSCEAEIATLRGISRSAVSQSVRVLIAKGLVEQKDEASDRRKKKDVLTLKGNELLDKVKPELESFAASLSNELHPTTVSAFQDTLESLVPPTTIKPANYGETHENN